MDKKDQEALRGPEFSYGLHYGEVILLDWLSKAKQAEEVPARFKSTASICWKQ